LLDAIPDLARCGRIESELADDQDGMLAPPPKLESKNRFSLFSQTQVCIFRGTPNGLRNFWLGWSGKDMSDHEEKFREDAAFRPEVAERVGIGFELPKPSAVPNIGNVLSTSEQEELVKT